ncbi:MAG: Do family serine endopeptidase [Desulfobacteraceae bacterium]|nr:Do family serine endopeptidase [Desulfobacteraceae bacterium]
MYKNRKKIILLLIIIGTMFFLQGVGFSATQMVPVDFSQLAEKAKPAVVNIRTVKTIKGGGRVFRHFFDQQPHGGQDLFRDFMGPFLRQMPQEDQEQKSLGSGFIISRDGYIVTNNHVIEDADEIKVKLYNEKEYDAKIIGRDSKTDLALIKIDAKNLVPLELGNSKQVKVGTWVVAIGSPFGLEQTVTAGIVSAKGRVLGAGPYDDFIQTDASINPGNSGGPLLNLRGEVIGINTAIIRSGQGIGFAIPSDLANGIIRQLKTSGEVSRGWIGVSMQDITKEIANYYNIPQGEGVLIADVFKGHPADKAGIEPGDILIAINNQMIHSAKELSRAIAGFGDGKKIKITITRKGKEIVKNIKLGKRSEMEPGQTLSKTGFDSFGFKFGKIDPSMAQKFGIKQNKTGLLVLDLERGSSAAATPIRQGDILKEINRVRVNSLKEYTKVIQKIKENDPVQLLFVQRAGNLLVVTFKK